MSKITDLETERTLRRAMTWLNARPDVFYPWNITFVRDKNGMIIGMVRRAHPKPREVK